MLVIAIATLAVTVVGIPLTVYLARPPVKVTAEAELDCMNYLSVKVTAGRSSVTVTRVRPVVFFDPAGQDPGETQWELGTAYIEPTGEIDLGAKQGRLFGIQLTMEDQELPSPDGTAPVKRSPRREEVRVRVDYGDNKKMFVKPEPRDYAIQHAPPQ
jgi:hypothetical protein